MGLVIKQTLKGAIYSYLGVILGGINVAILFPIIFSEEQIGLINILLTVSAICAQFASLGSNGIINYFFPKFQSNNNPNGGFFVVICLISAVGFIIFTVIYWMWPEYFLASKDVNSSIAQDYNYLLYPLTFFTLGFIITDTFCASTLNAVIGVLFKEVVIRVVILVLSLLYLFNLIDFELFIILYVFNMAIPVIVILSYLIRKKHVSASLPKYKNYAPHFRHMMSVGGFYIITGLSNILATYIDKFMINYFIGLKFTGIYSITNYFGSLVRIPRSSMGKIATPLIAKAIEDKDDEKLAFFFEKSSLSQVLIGTVIFLLIWTNIDSILEFLPANYSLGKWVVFYISLSNLFMCFLGVGGLIISVSKYYKYATYSTIILGIFVVLFNFILIPNFGIEGAAAATALAKFCFVIVYLIFINIKMNIKVINKDYIRILPAFIISYFISIQLSDIDFFEIEIINIFITIVFKSSLALAIFIIVLFLFGFKVNYKSMKELF